MSVLRTPNFHVALQTVVCVLFFFKLDQKKEKNKSIIAFIKLYFNVYKSCLVKRINNKGIFHQKQKSLSLIQGCCGNNTVTFYQEKSHIHLFPLYLTLNFMSTKQSVMILAFFRDCFMQLMLDGFINMTQGFSSWVRAT